MKEISTRPRLGLAVSHLFAKPSPRLRRLAEAADVLEIKSLPEPAWLPPDKPRVFHWGLGPVLTDFKKRFVAEGLDRYLAERPVELFSFDLGPAAGRHVGILPVSPVLGETSIFRRSAEALSFVRRHYKGPLAAENYNYYPSGLYRRVAEPDFIARYLEEFGLGLVLDLGHAAISAHNLSRGFEDYVLALPLDKLCELHVSRPFLPRGKNIESGGPFMAVDRHGAPAGREWGWLEFVLAAQGLRDGPIVLIEYYEKSGKLVEAQAALSGILNRG